MVQAVPAWIFSAVTAATAVGGTIATLASGPSATPSTPQIQRDDASSVLAANDAVAARKGGAADILNGDAGISQQMPGPKMVLGA